MAKTDVPPPGTVFEAAENAVAFVRRSLGVTLDYSPETLSVLDHYLSGVPRDQSPTRELVATAAGAYFGEVARRALGGVWEQTGEPAACWRIRATGDVTFHPFALALEAIVRDDVAEVDATFAVPPPFVSAVEDALSRQGEVSVDEYYSLAGRLEVLTCVVEIVFSSR